MAPNSQGGGRGYHGGIISFGDRGVDGAVPANDEDLYWRQVSPHHDKDIIEGIDIVLDEHGRGSHLLQH